MFSHNQKVADKIKSDCSFIIASVSMVAFVSRFYIDKLSQIIPNSLQQLSNLIPNKYKINRI